MAIQSATPYFILGGRAREAMALYETALGARVTTLQRFGDVDGSCPIARRDLVMHAELRIGDARVMMSDGPEETPAPDGIGSVSVALSLDDADEARRCFEALSVSGWVIQPLQDSPWGSLFGVVRDGFGVHWMFDCVAK